MDEEDRAQDDADVADVERRLAASTRDRVGAMTSNTVVPKSVERTGVSPVVGEAGAANDMLIGDETPPIESSESWRDTCSGLSPTDARPWGPCCARDDADPCGSPRLPRLATSRYMSANQFEKKSEAWSALFTEPTSELSSAIRRA
jgi:hypothetical protein